MATIPASQIVAVTPSVLNAGGRALDVIGVMLTDSKAVPVGTVQRFATALDVKNYFGAQSVEGALATIYFNGYDNSFIKPGLLKFTQYPTADVAAYLRGGTFTLTLAQLQALAVGTISIPINGVAIIAAAVDLSTATSFSNAAQIIQAAFAARTPDATAAGNTISGTSMTLGGAITGVWAPGQMVTGTDVPAGTYIKSLISGTPNTDGAVYELSQSATVAVGEAMTGVVVPLITYDSTFESFVATTVLAGSGQTIDFAAAGDLPESLNLTQSNGAVTSQGAAAQTDPGAFMDALVAIDQDWATFMTTFDPDNAGVHTNKLVFAEWTGQQNNRYGYSCWDTDVAASQQNPAVTSLGYAIQQAQLSGTMLFGGDGTNAVTASYAAFQCGFGAALDFTRTNGRATLAFKSQSGLVATCSNASKARNLMSNGYNFYGAYATANQEFIWCYNGQISGIFLWADSYINQIWMNNGFQLALMVLLQNVGSIPYNQDGYSLIEAALRDPINRALNFGAIRSGVTLSASQIAEVNNEAGVDVATTINRQGWYLQVLDADPQVRQNRQSPPCTFWYTDGQSVQQINLASVELT